MNSPWREISSVTNSIVKRLVRLSTSPSYRRKQRSCVVATTTLLEDLLDRNILPLSVLSSEPWILNKMLYNRNEEKCEPMVPNKSSNIDSIATTKIPPTMKSLAPISPATDDLFHVTSRIIKKIADTASAGDGSATVVAEVPSPSSLHYLDDNYETEVRHQKLCSLFELNPCTRDTKATKHTTNKQIG